MAQEIADLVSLGRRVLDVRPALEAPRTDGYEAAWLVTYGPLPTERPAAVMEAER